MSQLAAILLELKKRKQTKPQVFFDEKFPSQYKAITSSAKLKAYNCTRRAGKTIGAIKECVSEMVQHPRSKHIYFALTRDSARDIAWQPLQDELDSAGVIYNVNEQRSIITLHNGSSVKFRGLDSSYKEMRKTLGQSLKGVYIDEAGSVTIDLYKVVYQIIGPTLIDEQGRLRLMGTCENIPQTFFQKVVEGEVKGWEVHRWTTYDNPYLKDLWSKEIDQLKEDNPNVINTSWFRTHYLNEWVTDDNLKIYPHVTSTNSMPLCKLSNFTLSVDLGLRDDSSFTISSEGDDNKLYYLRSYKKDGMTFDDIALEVEALRKKYVFNRIVVDGANAQGVETMRQRYRIPFKTAQKTEKVFYMSMLSDDLKCNKAVVLAPDCMDLLNEMEHLQFRNEERKEEDPRCQNHCTDGMLYAYRESRHFLERPQVDIEIKKDSEEYFLKQLLGEHKNDSGHW